MKILTLSGIIISMILISGCTGKGGAKNNSEPVNDTVSVPDTGYTGISRGMSGQYVVNEVTYKNGIREGLTKTFYKSGRLRTTKWYVNGLVQDSVSWFYEEGQLFRTTPYRNDTIDGIQKQYYRTGQLKAKIGYSKGLRTPFIQEFGKEGKLITGYPELVVKTQDTYNSDGIYRITLSLTDKSVNAKYFRGEFINGLYDTSKVEGIRTKDNIGYLNLKKTNSPKPAYVGVIAEILTDFGNRLLVYRRIDLPYKDLD